MDSLLLTKEERSWHKGDIFEIEVLEKAWGLRWYERKKKIGYSVGRKKHGQMQSEKHKKWLYHYM